jgi:hypothetical protein
MKIKNDPAVQLYLNLMKKTLSYSLWKEPGIPIETFNYKRKFLKRFIVEVLSKILRIRDFQIIKNVNYDKDKRELGMIWPPMQAETMIGMKRLNNIQYCVESIIKDNIQGDLIETGVWRGGACIFMRAIIAAYGITNRRVFVADSFEGLPKPDEFRYPQDRDDKLYTENFLSVPLEEVKNNFQKYDLLDEQVMFLKGWFKDTLPNAPIERLSVMRLDGDLYQSTIESLTYLYPKLSIGGYCIIDDYSLKGCRQAVNNFREENNIKVPLVEIDWTGVFWRKE